MMKIKPTFYFACLILSDFISFESEWDCWSACILGAEDEGKTIFFGIGNFPAKIPSMRSTVLAVM